MIVLYCLNSLFLCSIFPFRILNYFELYAFLVGDNVNLQPDTGKAVL